MALVRALLAAFALIASTAPASAQQPAPAGQFDYYLLTLSWSPAYCLQHRHDPRARDECAQHRGFIVHGLWPQNDDGTWPASCRPVPPVPDALVAHEVAIMPNAGMIQHEWDKHGSCTGLTAADYFTAIDAAFARFHLPAVLAAPREPVSLPLADAKRLVAAANPGLASSMFSMRCTHGSEVDELRLCLDKSFHYRSCDQASADSCSNVLHFDPILGME
jgi:ribonuclease T2